MNFISVTFVLLFPAVLFIYWKLPWKYGELFLLAVSYFFYIKESSWAGGLLFLTTVITYLSGIAIEKGRHKKGWLIFTVAVCMGLLIGLKYSVPPVGISFYTFQTMAYVIDVYRGEISAEKKSTQLCPVCFLFSTVGCRPDRESGEPSQSAERKAYEKPGRSGKRRMADAPRLLQKSCRGGLSGCLC